MTVQSPAHVTLHELVPPAITTSHEPVRHITSQSGVSHLKFSSVDASNALESELLASEVLLDASGGVVAASIEPTAIAS